MSERRGKASLTVVLSSRYLSHCVAPSPSGQTLTSWELPYFRLQWNEFVVHLCCCSLGFCWANLHCASTPWDGACQIFVGDSVSVSEGLGVFWFTTSTLGPCWRHGGCIAASDAVVTTHLQCWCYCRQSILAWRAICGVLITGSWCRALCNASQNGGNLCVKCTMFCAQDTRPPRVTFTSPSLPGSRSAADVATFAFSGDDASDILYWCKLSAQSVDNIQTEALAFTQNGTVADTPVAFGEWLRCNSPISYHWLLPGMRTAHCDHC
jgi:hypothetical protein